MFRISQKQRQELKKIASAFKLRLILAFGSEVKGQSHAFSDLDIAVLCQSQGDFNWRKYSRIIFSFEKVFPGKKIDLVFIHRADPLLLHKISQSYNCLYGEEKTLAEFLLLTFKKYQDYHPFFCLEERLVTNFIKGGRLSVY